MVNTAYQSLISPLVSFGKQLNISSEVWSNCEELNQIYFSNSELATSKIANLKLAQMVNLTKNLGKSLTCEFSSGELPLLQLDSNINQSQLEEFKTEIRQMTSVSLVLKIDKQILIKKLFNNTISDNLYPILFLFSKPLENFLMKGLIELERQLRQLANKKLIILVAEQLIVLEGKYISVLGGQEIFNLNNLSTPNDDDFEQIYSVVCKQQETLNWQDIKLNFLTPFNFEFQQLDESQSNITNIFNNYAVQLICLYLADRSQIRGQNIVSTFNTTKKSVEIKIDSIISLNRSKDREDIKSLFDLFKWVYATDKTSYDKNSITQITIVQILQSFNEHEYYRNLISKATVILNESQWRTKAIVESQIDNYIQQELKLEDYINGSISDFEQEIDNLIKSISETIKNAIAITIASFIAALLKGNFNPLVFRLCIGIYLIYILIFPLYITMLNQNRRYKLMVDNFNLRIKRFKNNLYPEKVDEIVGNRLTETKKRFNNSFNLIICIYIIMMIIGILAMIFVPGLI